ncbi:uncharacterized protein [Nicotiana tomentosiformis]|uniref:uncharacterized protein n=1 Tax=Nicotiana tomentosiformis TaxID=4098 RepID=UPI00388CCADE
MDEPGSPVNQTMYRGNAPYMPSKVSLELQEHEAKENMMSIAAEGTLVGGYEVVSESQGGENGAEVQGRELVPVETLAPDSTTGESIEGHDPSAQEDPSASTWDKTLGSTQEPHVSTDLVPSPHFYAEPLTIVVPEMRSLSEEEKEDSEEKDYDNVALANFISARSRKKKKKRRLVKDGKVVNEKVVAPALIVNVDDEVEEERGPLVRKSSKKFTIPKSKRGSSVSEKELSKVEGEKSGEKEDEKMVEESYEKVAEESAEKISRKSAEKGKSVRKSMKRKVDASEEPGSSKKTKKLEARNAILEGQLSQLQEAPGSSSSHSTEVARLTKENADLRKQVEDLKEKLLNEYMSANARMDILINTLASSSKPFPSSAP